MNRLSDMGHFPVAVNAGATGNVLVTIVLTSWLESRAMQPWAPIVWVAFVLACNLLPVVLLRFGLNEHTPYPSLREMNFWRDQHKFSDWVYIAASANMAFWVLISWAVFEVAHTPGYAWRHAGGRVPRDVFANPAQKTESQVSSASALTAAGAACIHASPVIL